MSSSGPLWVALISLAAAAVACGDDASGSGGGGGDTSTGTTSGTTTASASTTTGATTSTGQGGDTSATGSGGETATGTGGGGSGGDGSGGDGTGGQGVGGGSVFADDCDTADDCPGGECFELPGGFRTCKTPVVEATECLDEQDDECCATDECEGDDICVQMPDVYCGGPQPIEHNECVPSDDSCQGLDCGKSSAACIPPGVYGYATGVCAARHCNDDDQCSDEEGGRCVPVFDPCCGAVSGFFCAYPSDGCRDQQHCGDDQHCQGNPETGRSECVEGPPQCPA
jgi:hypothetical protein